MKQHQGRSACSPLAGVGGPSGDLRAESFHSLLLVQHLRLDLLQLPLEAAHPVLGQVNVGLEKVRVILGAAKAGVGVH